MAEAGLHGSAHVGLERLARRAQYVVDDRRRLCAGGDGVAPHGTS